MSCVTGSVNKKPGSALQTDMQRNVMFVVLLKFAEGKARASQFMEGHKEWLQRGFDDGTFLLAGNLQPGAGGAILAHGTSLPEIRSRVDDDPFVAENVVSVEILEITASKADERLKFLLG